MGKNYAEVIGLNVRMVRKGKGLTQAELAAWAGMRVPAVSRLESGTHLPSLSTLLKVAEALDVEPCKLLSPPKKPRAARRGRP